MVRGRVLRSFVWTLVFAAGPGTPPAQCLGQDLLITEFLALNDTGLTDEEGDPSDWLEIQNRGAARVDLKGWYLTDRWDDLRSWSFPDVAIEPGAFLVVFASGKDRSIAGAPLHTNFRLSGDGEYLALVMPDGRTVAHAFEPAYPPQRVDISCGFARETEAGRFVAEDSASRIRVPADGSLGLAWVRLDFDDASWAGATAGVGYDRGKDVLPPPDERENLAPAGEATQSSTWGNGQFPAELAIDGNLRDFTATATGDNRATWELDLGAVHQIGLIVLHNRADCCPSRLRDITVTVLDAEREPVWESELLNPENIMGGGGTGGPPSLAVDLIRETGGSVAGQFVRVRRTSDPDLSGTRGAGNADEPNVLSLAEVEVFEAGGGLRDLIATDIETVMAGIGSTVYVRIPFDVPDPSDLDILILRVWYDDGFIAYLNGFEVARRNAPGSPGEPAGWSAAAASERSPGQARVAEEIPLTAYLGLLAPGPNILAIQGLNRRSDDAEFLLRPELVGLSASGEALRYFESPTPGRFNDAPGLEGIVADTRFSVDRGIHDRPFDVEIETETAGATIRYTLDGRTPTETHGEIYRGPIPIRGTTVLRAAAFRPGWVPANVDTQTYIFPDDVIEQRVMLPDVTHHPEYGPQVEDALWRIPSVSIVTSRPISASTEVEASVEFIRADGREGFQIDAGIRHVGGHSLSSYPKKMMRLYFRRQYGSAKLEYPLFEELRYGETSTDSFDQLQLRSGAHDSVFYLGDRQQLPADAQYIRNAWMSDMQFEMGQISLHGRFVHVYLNGTYWGHYQLMERPTRSHMAEYMGGADKDEYEAVNGGDPVGAPAPAWARIRTIRRDYDEVLRHVDVVDLVDYMLLNFYAGNAWDWRPNQNWMAGGPSSADRGGYKFICWDSDIIFRNTTDNNVAQGGPENLFRDLLVHKDFRVLLADRIHTHFFDGGILTPERAQKVYDARAEEIQPTIIAETARWRWGGRVWSRDLQWRAEWDRLRSDFFPRRTGIVLDQIRGAGWYPDLEAPSLSHPGGFIEPGLRLLIGAMGGLIYYTLDGTDPRLAGGGLSPAALRVDAPPPVILLAPGADVRVRVPADDSLGIGWTRIDFDDSGWTAGRTGVGFEAGSGYEDLIETDLEDSMYRTASSVYLRMSFAVDPDLLAGESPALAILALDMKYDDGFIAYLNGERVAARNAPADPRWDSEATQSHPDNRAVAFERISLEGAVALLRPGANLLAIHGLNRGAGSNDFLVLPQLSGFLAPDPIALDASTIVKARAVDGDLWSPLTEAGFFVDTPLRITEIMYHPAPPPEASPFEEADFEFIEMENIGDQALDLGGLRIGGGIRFSFGASAFQTLGPGDIIVIVKNAQAFATRYRTRDMLLAGEYDGRLDNLGEKILLYGPLGERILDFRYDGARFPETDGAGPSLVIVDPLGERSGWDDGASWRPSLFPFGSPGDSEAPDPPGGWQRPDDLNQDGAVDLADAIALLGILFGDGEKVFPCGDGTFEAEGNQALMDSNGDGSLALSDPIHLLNYLFAGGSPPALGTECTRIAGCPAVCR